MKGYAQSAPFAMGKFALRGLAQSMARELHPQGIHVAHVVIDGGIKSARRAEPADKPASLLDPDAIAATYLHLIHQPRSAWSWEIESAALGGEVLGTDDERYSTSSPRSASPDPPTRAARPAPSEAKHNAGSLGDGRPETSL